MPVTPAFKRNCVRIGLGLFAFHFLITGLYLLPGRWLGYDASNVVYHYMVPLFHQNWQLFAPEAPKSNNKLYYRWQAHDGKWSEWIDPGKAWLETHQTYRITYHGKLFDNYEAIGRKLNEDHYRYYQYCEESPDINEDCTAYAEARMPYTEAYILASRLVQQHLQDHQQFEASMLPQQLEFRFQRSWVPDPVTGEAKSETLNFPPFPFGAYD